MLAALDEQIIKLLGQKTKEVQFGGQLYKFWEIDKLFAVRQTIASQVAAEEAAASGSTHQGMCVSTFMEY
jgi:hypothetical protein